MPFIFFILFPFAQKASDSSQLQSQNSPTARWPGCLGHKCWWLGHPTFWAPTWGEGHPLPDPTCSLPAALASLQAKEPEMKGSAPGWGHPFAAGSLSPQPEHLMVLPRGMPGGKTQGAHVKTLTRHMQGCRMVLQPKGWSSPSSGHKRWHQKAGWGAPGIWCSQITPDLHPRQAQETMDNFFSKGKD